MKYFTIAELTKSATAKKKGINNTPNATQKAALVALVENILDPLREAYGKPIIVTSGFRCDKLNKAVGGAKTSQHCFDTETEILTNNGWRTFETIDEKDLVYSYNMTNGELELKPIDKIIIQDYDGRMLHVHSRHTDFMVTDKHRLLVRNESHKYQRKTDKVFSEEGQAYFDSLKTNNDLFHIEYPEDVFGKRRKFMCSGHFKGKKCENLDLYNFVMAFVCDGYWCKKDSALAMGFRFKKERKVQHLCTLADKLGWSYTINQDKHGVYNFYFRSEYAAFVHPIIGDKKMLPYTLLGFDEDDIRELLNCYAEYDGSRDKREGTTGITLSTSVQNNSDVLQAMATLCGLKCQIVCKPSGTYNIKGQVGPKKANYILSITPKVDTKVKEDSYEWIEDYCGIVWCVNNENTTLVTRRNGRVSIQGNCKGEAADIRAKSDNPEDNKKLWDLIIKLGLPFDQMINEYGFDWVHVSYGPRNRRQLLKAIKQGGSTKYYTTKP